MTNDSRTKKSIRNIAFLTGGKLIHVLLSFFARTLLIRYLGIEILGLDGLFTSIISVLSLAELGLSSAVIFSLYAPIANGGKGKIAAYINLFQQIYAIIGVGITVVGLAIIPILPKLIRLPADVENINLIYILTILGTSVSYFFSGRRIILEADQKKYVVTVVDTICSTVMQLIQIIVMVVYKNYIFVLCSRILCNLISNLCVQCIGNKQYPYLADGCKEGLSKKERRALFSNTRAVLCHKIGGVFVTGIDNLVISAFIGTVITGIYSNYLMLINTVTAFITVGLNALIPSVGNLMVESSDIKHHYKVYETVVLMNYVVSTFCSVVLLCLLNPFVELWLGKEFLLDESVVLLLCIIFYISTMRYGIGAFCTAAGYFKETVKKPIMESLINVLVSLALVHKLGLYGVFLGTLCSLLLGSVWVDPYILYKKWFKKDFLCHWKVYIRMVLFASAIGGISVLICRGISFERDYMGFVLKLLVSCLCTSVLVAVSTLFLPGHTALYNRIKKYWNKGKKNKENIF